MKRNIIDKNILKVCDMIRDEARRIFEGAKNRKDYRKSIILHRQADRLAVMYYHQ